MIQLRFKNTAVKSAERSELHFFGEKKNLSEENAEVFD